MNLLIFWVILSLFLGELIFLLDRKKPSKGTNVMAFTTSITLISVIIGAFVSGVVTLYVWLAQKDWIHFLTAWRVIGIGLGIVIALLVWIGLNSLKYRIK